MESIEAEVCVESGKSDRQGRRIRGVAEWSSILEHYDQSGLTQAAFCAREGLRLGTLVAWLGRRRKNGGILSEPAQSKPKFHELSLSRPSGEPIAELEVRLADGTIVRGAQASELAKLIRLLRV
jgi:hypothetical protein